MRKFLLPLSLLAFGGCVAAVEESRLSQAAVRPGQRTVLLVFTSPGPWVTSETDSKAESAALVLPGLSSIVSGLHEDRDLKAAQDLKQYLPRWNPREKFYPLLLERISRSAFAGRLITPSEAEISTEALRNYNRASDTLTWQKAYYSEDPRRGLPRNYSNLLSLDDALVLEVNLLYSAEANEDGNMIPTLAATTRLYRAATMKLLWKHVDTVDDAASARTMYEFKTLPQQLVDRWLELMPALASKVSLSMNEALGSSGAPAAAPPPATVPAPPAQPAQPAPPSGGLSQVQFPTATQAPASTAPTNGVFAPYSPVSESSSTAPSGAQP